MVVEVRLGMGTGGARWFVIWTAVVLGVAVVTAQAQISTTPDPARLSLALMVNGKQALAKGDFDTAIAFFQKAYELDHPQYVREALELLGIARERNKQYAHAKNVYESYLKRFPDGDDAARVRQRLLDILSMNMKPTVLSEAAPEGDSAQSRWTASLSQFYFRAENDRATGETLTEQNMLLNQVTADWRYRRGDYDIVSFAYGIQETDFTESGENRGEINSLYTHIRNKAKGHDLKVGRQSDSSGGVLGRFDGARAGWNMTKNQRVRGVLGYPVDYANKTRVQTNRPFWGVSMDWFDLRGELDLTLYYLLQEVDGMIDREATGVESRYFHNRWHFFSQADYDVNYDELNIFLFRGLYRITDELSFDLSVDYQKSPLISPTNALLNAQSVTSIEELRTQFTEDQINTIAQDRTGEITTISAGTAYNVSNRSQINASLSQARQTAKIANNLSDPSAEEVSSQNYALAQFITSGWLHERDTALAGIRWSDSPAYDEWGVSGTYRVMLFSKLALQALMHYDHRDEDDGEIVTKSKPGLRVDYAYSRNLRINADLAVESWHYSGTPLNSDFKRALLNAGYRWYF